MSNMMTTWPNVENSTGVSRTIRPVTHTADVEVKKASMSEIEYPDADAAGNHNRNAPPVIRRKMWSESS